MDSATDDRMRNIISAKILFFGRLTCGNICASCLRIRKTRLSGSFFKVPDWVACAAAGRTTKDGMDSFYAIAWVPFGIVRMGAFVALMQNVI